MSYRWIFTVVNASKLAPPKPGKNRNPKVTAKLYRLDGKSEHTVTSPACSGTDPVWNYKLYQFPAESVQGKYDCIKFTIEDNGEYLGSSKIKWEFIGEPPKQKNYTLRISSQKKKDPKITGLLKVHTCFEIIAAGTPSPKTRVKRSKDINRLSRKPADAARKLSMQGSVSQITDHAAGKVDFKLSEGTRVQFSAAGRREINITTSGVEKFITFGELPEFEILDYDRNEFKKKGGGEKYGFNLNNALWLVTCANLAYKDEEIIYDVCRNVWDMKGAVFLSNSATDTQGFCMHDDKICVVCFRGTESLHNWMTNLKFVLISGAYPERYTQEGLKVHQGFHEALSSVWDQVEDFVDSAYAKYPNLRLYICGHSLGGALASLCYSFFTLSDKPRFVSAVYTIGQPRVGNRKFKQLLEKSAPNTIFIRLTNNQDVVPTLAAGQHLGTHVHIDTNRRLSFKPPVWKKAMNEITSIQDAGKELQYKGIADHSGPVYRAIIEENWSRFQALQGKSASIPMLAETTLLIIDMLTESVKSARRYKPQFRAVVGNTIKLKPMIDSIADYTVIMTEDQSKKAEETLRAINSQLAFLHKEIVSRRKDKSILQRRNNHESALNKKLEKLCAIMQKHSSALDEYLGDLNLDFSEDIATRFGFNITRYDPSKYDINFAGINFNDISAKAMATRRTRDHTAEVGLMLDSAEEMIEEGELEMALQFLDKMPTINEVQKYMTDEQHATHSYLTAKCHAKLQHHTEAMEALKQLSQCSAASDDLIEDKDFVELASKDEKQFNHIAMTIRNVRKNRPPPEYEVKLKKNEIEILASIFDEYDDESCGFITVDQFSSMIDTIGVENLLFQLGWKSPKGVPQIFTIIKRIKEEYHGSVNLEIYLNLMSSLLPSETKNIGSSAARREKNAKKSGPAVWDMFGSN